MSKYTYKVEEKSQKRFKLGRHVVGHFPSRPELTTNCDGIGD